MAETSPSMFLTENLKKREWIVQTCYNCVATGSEMEQQRHLHQTFFKEKFCTRNRMVYIPTFHQWWVRAVGHLGPTPQALLISAIYLYHFPTPRASCPLCCHLKNHESVKKKFGRAGTLTTLYRTPFILLFGCLLALYGSTMCPAPLCSDFGGKKK